MEEGIFTGERWEAYSQLLFLRARYYEPGIGRFVSKDLFPGSRQYPVTLNLYLYTGNNPINHTDPAGYQGLDVLVQCMQGNPDCERALAAAVGLAEVFGGGLTIEIAAPVVLIGGPLAFMTVVCAAAPALCESPITVTPVPAPAPPLTIPEEGTVSPVEAEWIRQLYYAEPAPEPSRKPEPKPAPQPYRIDPVPPPCPTDTPEPKERHISLGFNYVHGKPALFYFTWRLNSRLNPYNVYVYSYGDWFREGLCSVNPPSNWPLAFDQASTRTRAIHFNLEGIPDPNYFVEHFGSSGSWVGSSITADELYLVKNRSELCSKTKFYRDGITVSMSAWQEICGE